MAIKPIQIREPDNYENILHPETDATMVVMPDGSTLKQSWENAPNPVGLFEYNLIGGM